MHNPSRIRTIIITMVTSGATVKVISVDPIDPLTCREIAEIYACHELKDINEVTNAYLGEVFESQDEYFLPDPEDIPVVKRRRKKRKSKQ